MGKNGSQFVFNFIFRILMGVCVIYLANAFFDAQDIPIKVGYNMFSLLTSGILGLPGVGALYGIVGLHLL